MRYLGGKTKLAKDIVVVIRPKDHQLVWEPFCGGGAITSEISHVLVGSDTQFLVSDVRPELVNMWQAVSTGWEPPEIGRNLTDGEYQALKSAADSPIRTFVGFGCSFGGKWWGGLARSARNEIYYEEGRRLLIRKSQHIRSKKPVFRCIDFLSLTVAPPQGTLIYCDPPYRGTTGYGQVFDHDRFWSICRWLARSGCVVFVSEFTAPAFCTEVWRKTRKLDVRSVSSNVRNDCLFRVNP